METVPDWLHDELLTGLQKLLCLSLPGTPALDLIAGTALAWGEALTYGRVWDEERDVPRIRAGFKALLALSSEWPAPQHLLDVLPSAEAPERITHDRGIPHAGDTSERARLARLRHLGEIFAADPNLKDST